MKRFLIIAVFSIFILHLSAAAGNAENTGSLRQEAEDRRVSDFTGILLSGPYNVLVTLGTTEAVKVEGSTEARTLVETVVENGVLKIRPRSRFGKPAADAGNVTVNISAKSLDALALSGSGTMTINGTIHSKILNTSVSGSGSMTFYGDADDLKSVISGSGSITATGRVTHAVVTISGSGKFYAGDLEVKTADVRITGSGEVTIDARDHLSAILVGSGHIFYREDPHVDIVTKIGSGSVARMREGKSL